MPPTTSFSNSKPDARLQRLEAHDHARELAGAAGLLLVRVVDLGGLRDRLAIGHLRLADARLHLELAPHAVDDDVEMQLAHAGDDRLAGFLVGLHAERRILGGEPAERDAHLLLVGLGVRLDGDLDDRLGELHALQDDRLQRIAERVAGRRVLQAHHRDDVAGEGFLDLFAVVGMHQQHAADPLAPVLDGVGQRRAGLELARIDAAEGERADERDRS